MKKEQWQLPKDVFISSEATIYVRQVGLGGNGIFGVILLYFFCIKISNYIPPHPPPVSLT